MKNIPKDPFMLVSYINTQMRDYYGTLDELCLAIGVTKDEICDTLSEAGFGYDEELGRFL